MYIDGNSSTAMDPAATAALAAMLAGLKTSPNPRDDPLLGFIWGAPGTTAYTGGAGPIMLDPPAFDVASIAALLGMLQNKVNNLRIETAGQQIQTAQTQRESYNKQVMGQLDEVIEKAFEALDKQKQIDIVGMVKAVFEVIGAVLAVALSIVATAASVGAAAASIAGAFIGLAMAMLDLANEIAKTQKAEVTGPDGKKQALDLSVGGMVNAIVQTQIAQGTIKFASEKEKNDYLTGWTITSNVIIMITSIASGIPGMKNCASLAKDAVKGVTEALDKLSQTAKLTEVVARGLAAIADLGQGAATASQGVFTIQSAGIDEDSDKARAKKALMEAFIDAMSQFISGQIDVLKNANGELNDILQSATSTMASAMDTQLRVAHNVA